MKFLAGFLTSIVIVALVLTGIYAYNKITSSDDNPNVQSSEQSDNQSNEIQTQQTDEQETSVAEEPSENNDTIEQTSPNKPSAQQSIYLTDAEKNEYDQLTQKKLDAMNGKSIMSSAESERLRNLTARLEASRNQ